jgi:hypothetical protein
MILTERSLAPYEVIGEPADSMGAQALAEVNRHQFEWWALGLVDAFPAQDKKKGADKGVDGVIYFKDDAARVHKKIVVQVKSGHVNAAVVRDLKGVLDREQAAIGALITLKPPTRPMKEEATDAGFYVPEHFSEHRFPRIQILTIAELFAGKKLEYPQWAPPETFKKAARRRKGPTDAEKQGQLDIWAREGGHPGPPLRKPGPAAAKASRIKSGRANCGEFLSLAKLQRRKDYRLSRRVRRVHPPSLASWREINARK